MGMGAFIEEDFLLLRIEVAFGEIGSSFICRTVLGAVILKIVEDIFKEELDNSGNGHF